MAGSGTASGGMGGSGMAGGGMGGQPAGSRLPGPHPSEWGQITFWRWIATSELTWADCSNDPSWKFSYEQPVFGEDAFLFYRVEPGGATATGLSGCTLSGAKCEDTSVLWTIKGHTLTAPGAGGKLFNGDAACAFILTTTYTTTDNGTAALWQVRIDVDPDPAKPDCAALDSSIKASSPNGHGLLDCHVSYDVFLSFEHTVPPK